MQNGLNAHISELIKAIDVKLAEHNYETKTLNQTKISLQNICRHEFTNTGRDHNYFYEQCTICGQRRKE